MFQIHRWNLITQYKEEIKMNWMAQINMKPNSFNWKPNYSDIINRIFIFVDGIHSIRIQEDIQRNKCYVWIWIFYLPIPTTH